MVANVKEVYLPYELSGQSGLYARVYQVSTACWLDNIDGIFRLTPGDPNIPLTEQTGGPSVYYFSENRTVWVDGLYLVYGYTAGGNLFAGAEYSVLEDEEIGTATLVSYMGLIKKIELGDWELKLIGSDAFWIVYDTDHITPLMQFKCFDSEGRPTVENIFKRVKQ
jgi:hypothetical protein